MTNLQLNRKGHLIAFEGIDGSGTSTHSRHLYEFLVQQGLKVLLTGEPTNGIIGRLIKNALQNECQIHQPEAYALLFAADRIQHVKEVIEPALKQGFIVITTRYIESSIAYQSAQGLSIDWIKEINQYIIWPELTIILDISPEKALLRIKGRNKLEKFETIEFLRKVRRIFLQRAKERGYPIIDTTPPIQETHQVIREYFSNFLRRNIFGK